MILGLLANSWTANYEYSCSDTNNLPLPLQMQLSEKLKTFTELFLYIFGISIKFGTFCKEDELHSCSFSEVIDSQRHVYLNA